LNLYSLKQFHEQPTSQVNLADFSVRTESLNRTGIHLLEIICKMSSSNAVRPILLNMLNIKTANKQCSVQNQLRWDQADLISYYFCTRNLLGPPLTRLDEALLLYDNGNLTPGDVFVIVDEDYYDIVNILVSCAKNFVPERRKAFYNFWWDAELTLLCIRLPNFVQIDAPTAEIRRHIHFSRWRPLRLYTTFGFVSVDVIAFRRSKSISKPNFVEIS